MVCYQELMQAGSLLIEGRFSKCISSGMLALPVVAISEALRFLLLQGWVLEMLSREAGFEEFVPTEFSNHFHNWENDSYQMFQPNPPAHLATKLGILKKNSRIIWPPVDKVNNLI
jgi:hypothetical protein